jgi:hypothetical protein
MTHNLLVTCVTITSYKVLPPLLKEIKKSCFHTTTALFYPKTDKLNQKILVK